MNADMLKEMLEQVKAGDMHLAGTGGEVAGNHIHCGGFTGAVGAEKPQDLAPLQMETDIMDRVVSAEVAAEVIDLYQLVVIHVTIVWT